MSMKNSLTWEFKGLHYLIVVMTQVSIIIKIIGAGIGQWYSTRLRAGWSGVRVQVGAGNFSPHHRIQTDSGAHPTSYPMGTRGSFPGGKVAGA
jgi:hypothetical protein